MKRMLPRLRYLPAVVCLLLALALAPAGLAQNKAATKSEKRPQADKTLSSKGAPVVTIAPKSPSTPRASYLSLLEQEILDEMNLARTEPQRYAAFVEEFKSYYRGNQFMPPGRGKATVTVEGVAAVDEAINFLKTAKPVAPMAVNRGMSLAAKDHSNDLVLKGISGHRGSDGSSPNARLDRYGRWEGVVGENIVYEVSTARQIVIGLIIDDGTSNRGHRRNVFDPDHHVTGISVTDSASNGARCVLTYAGGFQEKGAAAGSAPSPRRF